MSYGLIRKAWYCEVWYGQSRQGKAVAARSDKAGWVKVRLGGFGESGHVSIGYG